MQRSSIIATVIAAGGVLIAGSVASVAVVNAVSSVQPESTTLALVSAAEASPSATASPTASVEPAGAPVALPTVEAVELPVIPMVEQASPVADEPRAEASEQPTPQKPATKPSPKPSRQQAAQTQRKPSRSSASASPSSSPSEDAPATRQISGEKAVELVLQATGGGTAQAVDESSHQGYDAWAVRLTRHDGSIVTGYVERSTGVIYDWVVNAEAPVGSGTAGSSDYDDDSDDDYEDESDDYEDESDDD